MTARPRVACVASPLTPAKKSASATLIVATNISAVVTAGTIVAGLALWQPAATKPAPKPTQVPFAKGEEVFVHLACQGADLITAADVLRWGDPSILERVNLTTGRSLQAYWSTQLTKIPAQQRANTCTAAAERAKGRGEYVVPPTAAAPTSQIR